MRRSTASLLYLLLGVFGGIGFSFYCGYCIGSRIEDYDDPRGYITKDELLKEEVALNDKLYELVHYGYFALSDDEWENLCENPEFGKALDAYITLKGGDTEDLFFPWK